MSEKKVVTSADLYRDGLSIDWQTLAEFTVGAVIVAAIFGPLFLFGTPAA